MTKRNGRVQPGDVVEFEVEGRFSYLHYIGKHPAYGDAVVVKPGFEEHRLAVDAQMFTRGYITFYPLNAALRHALVRVIGHLPPPRVPNRLRRAGVRRGGRVETWIIEDGTSEVLKTTLSEEELRIPIASLWNHEFLIQRVLEGWTPEQEGRAS